MATYIRLNVDGEIVASSNYSFDGSVLSTKDVIRGYDGKLYFVDEAPQKPQSMIQAENESAIRLERDKRLHACDYIMMPDYPMADKIDWTTYRQALRDITSQDGFPWNGNIDRAPWPAKPTN